MSAIVLVAFLLAGCPGTHMAEARRPVSTLRPNIGEGEDVAAALKRILADDDGF